MFRFILSIILLAYSYITFANDIQTISGEYTFYGEKHHSLSTCENYALEYARLNALTENFGVNISQDILQHDVYTDQNYSAYNITEISGEWICDIENPKYEYSITSNGLYIVTCKVIGNARKISNTNNIDISANILRNGTTIRNADNNFKSGDDLYVHFKSPIDGYVAIFVIGDDNEVFRLLPYSYGDVTEIFVKHDKEYVFFSDACRDISHGTVDELKLHTINSDVSVEYNNMYVIFSPNKFVKPVDNKTMENIPPILNYEEFNKWLKTNCIRDKNMVIKKIHFSISSK